MAITNGYLTLDEAKADLGIGDNVDNPRVERAVESASRLVDAWCGQRFWEDPEDTTRYFTPHAHSVLRLAVGSTDFNAATLTAVTSVAFDTTGNGMFDQTWTEDTHYFLAPRGAGASDRPYDRLRVLPAAARTWLVGVPDAVEIVGTFGWPAVPAAVKEATAIQAQVLFKRATEGAAPIVTMDGTTLQGGSKFLDRGAELLLADYQLLKVTP